MFARYELYSLAYLNIFSGSELWATDEPARDLSDVCAKLRHRDQWVASLSSFDIGLRCLAFNSTIDKLPDCAVVLFSGNSKSLARFLFWTTSHVFM